MNETSSAYGLWSLVIIYLAVFILSTILMFLMFPLLVYMYLRLARDEEMSVRAEFGTAYEQYARIHTRFCRVCGFTQKGGRE